MTVTRTKLKYASISLALALLCLAGPDRALANSPEEVAGIWKNEMQDTRTGSWRTLSWFNVGMQKGRPVMRGVDFSVVAADVGLPRSVSRITVGNNKWSYIADVDGRKFQIDLTRVGATHYEGRYSINGRLQRQRRRMVRIADQAQLRRELDQLLAQLANARATTEQLIALQRQNQQHWRFEAERERGRVGFVQPDGTILVQPSVGTGALQSIFQIQATGRLGKETIRLQQILDRIQAATELRNRL